MSNDPIYSSTSNPQHQDPLLNRFFLSPQERYDWDFGQKVVKAFYQTQTSNSTSLNYFRLRNARWIELLLWAKGSQKMAEFLSFMSVSDANKAWLNIDMEQSRIASQFLGTLVESMAKNRIYPCVTAIDDGSVSQKDERLFDALFRMHEVQTINDVQQASGMTVEHPTAYVPDDETAARVYYELVDRLPKEIDFQKKLRFIQNEINFDFVANKKSLYNLIVTNFAATKIERASPGNYTVRMGVPTNMLYNFFLTDTGECEISEIGEFYNIKVKDFRKKFAKSPDNPNGMSEKEIFELARASVNRNIGTFNYMWDQNWAQTTYYLNRPYDDYSILVMDVEMNFGEDAYYVEKTDNYGRTNIERKSGIPYQTKDKSGNVIQQPKPDNVNIIKRQKSGWMRGIYAPYGDKMLYWGDPDLIISPYTNTDKQLSTWSVVMANNDGEYVPSLFERIMEPLREYQLTKLTRKKLIAQVKPSGIRIDVESARNIDLGNGESISWEEQLRIYLQTGVEVYSSKGLDPLQREPPALANPLVRDETIQKIIGLTDVLNSIGNEIRQLIGVPPYRDGTDVGDRTAAELAQSQNKSSYNVTDFISDYNSQLWQQTFYKLCLLNWNDVVKKSPESDDDMISTRFDVSIRMKLTDYEKQLLESDIARYSQMPDKEGNPLISPKDAIMLREIDDYKLACLYLDATVTRNRKNAQDDIDRATEKNAEVQQQSAQQAAQGQMAADAQKLQAEKEMKEYEALQQMKVAIVQGSFQIAAKGQDAQFPKWLAPILTQLVPNIAIPIAAENKDMQNQIMAGLQQGAADNQQQQQPDQQDQSTQPPPQQQNQLQSQQ